MMAVTTARKPGFALLLVMGGLFVMSLIAVMAAKEGRSEAALASATVAGARAEAAAEGGIHLAVAMFRHADAARRWPMGGTPTSFDLGGARVTVRLWDEGGKVDVNQAPLMLLQALFRAAEGTEAAAARLASRVDEARRTAPLQAVAEVRVLTGLDTVEWDRLRNWVTVYTGQHGVDLAAAPEGLAAALAGEASGSEGAVPALPVEFQTQSRRRVFRITAVAETPGGATFRRSAVIRLLQADGNPFVVHAWE